jgi:hypothetical protein
MIRGGVGITLLVFLTGLFALPGIWIKTTYFPKQDAQPDDPPTAAYYLWSVSSMIGAAILYFAVLIPMFWDLEMNAHTTIAAVFPMTKTDEYLKDVLPCGETFKHVIREKGKFPFVPNKEDKTDDAEDAGKADAPKTGGQSPHRKKTGD